MPYTEGMLDLEEYPVEIRVRILAAQVNASAGLGMWLFLQRDCDEERLVYSTCIKEKEFYSFFRLGGIYEKLDEYKTWDRPAILSDPLGITWAAETAGSNTYMLIVMGPFFLKGTSRRQVEETLSRRISSVQMKLEMLRTLNEIPVISSSVMDQYCKMLHYTLTSRRIQSADFIQVQCGGSADTDDDAEIAYPMDADDRVIEGEKHMLNAVRDGNQRYREIMEKERLYEDEFICSTGDPMRDAKTTVIASIVLTGRAAMDGGLSAKAMRAIERRYIEKAEKCRTVTDLRRVKDAMLDEYVKNVHKAQDSGMISKCVRDSCDYIKANVHKPLTVEEIAANAGYTTYYFTKKFNKEMGIKVTDYIKQARIAYAKVALLTTDQSIQDISDSLQFGSRNYFSKVFRAEVGMTPAAYREQNTWKGGTDHEA